MLKYIYLMFDLIADMLKAQLELELWSLRLRLVGYGYLVIVKKVPFGASEHSKLVRDDMRIAQ